MKNLVATASTHVAAPPAKVWEALVNPTTIKKYMFGTTVAADWREGGRITWKGEWKGRAYEDKGTIVAFKPGRTLGYTHFSPLAGLPDTPENYHNVMIELSDAKPGTKVVLTQDKNTTEEEQQHAAENWRMMLEGLKKVVES